MGAFVFVTILLNIKRNLRIIINKINLSLVNILVLNFFPLSRKLISNFTKKSLGSIEFPQNPNVKIDKRIFVYNK